MNSQIFHKRNIRLFFTLMQPDSIAIFVSNDEVQSNGDTLYGYKQNSNVLWLCGIEQPKTTVVLIKSNKSICKEHIFISATNKLKEIWDGKFLTKEQVKEINGFENIHYNEELEDFLQKNINNIQYIYLDSNENDRKNGYFKTADYALIENLQKKYPLHNFERAAVILKYLRSIKHPFEIELIKKAIEITSKTFHKILQTVKPNIFEYEIQAEMVYNFIKMGGSGFSFSPIIASGDNARILHYISNQNKCLDGELLLMDFGVLYKNYPSDITRTIPVNGKFTNRQKEIYNACLHLQNFARSILKPRILIADYTKKVGNEATKLFLKMGLLKTTDVKNENPDNRAYRKYLYHGISHHLGLDIHDLADPTIRVEENMLLTIEPGIYIEEEKIGVRIENNFLITKDGNINLSSSIPVEINDIEKIMKEK